MLLFPYVVVAATHVIVITTVVTQAVIHANVTVVPVTAVVTATS